MRTIQTVGITPINGAINNDRTDTIPALVTRIWPHVIRSLRFLVTNIDVSEVNDSVKREDSKVAQVLVSTISMFFCALRDVDCLKSSIHEDAVVFAMVIQIYLKQDVDYLSSVEPKARMSGVPSGSPARIIVS